jgi:hypothetical protein
MIIKELLALHEDSKNEITVRDLGSEGRINGNVVVDFKMQNGKKASLQAYDVHKDHTTVIFHFGTVNIVHHATPTISSGKRAGILKSVAGKIQKLDMTSSHGKDADEDTQDRFKARKQYKKDVLEILEKNL